MVLLVALTPVTGVRADAQKCEISAEGESVGICGDAENSTIIIGVPQNKVDDLVKERTEPLEDLTVAQRDTIALLKEKLELNERQLRAAFDILDEANVPPEKLAEKLLEIAEQFKLLKASLSAQAGDDPKITSLKTQAQQAIDKGELDKADGFLAEIEAEQRKTLDRLAIDAAAIAAKRGDIGLARLRYVDAARHFDEAAALVPPGHTDEAANYLAKEGQALYTEGDQMFDLPAFEQSITIFRRVLLLQPRDRAPTEWAKTQRKLGLSLRVFADFESGSRPREQVIAHLNEAIAAYRAALEELTRDKTPSEWATTQLFLGTALSSLGSHETGTAHLEQAVDAYHASLGIKVGLVTLDRLGRALTRLGDQETGTAHLEEAVATFRSALQLESPNSGNWIVLQDDLAVALVALAKREENPSLLHEAIADYHTVLKHWTREQLPYYWARTQKRLGDALSLLGLRENGTAPLDEAIVAYRAASDEWARDRASIFWADAQKGLGDALYALGLRETGTKRLDDAVSAWQACLTVAAAAWEQPEVEALRRKIEQASAEAARRSGK